MHRGETIGLDTGLLHDRAMFNVREVGLALGGVGRAAQRWPRGRRRAPDGDARTCLPRLVAAGRISCHQRGWLAVGSDLRPVRACAVAGCADCECALRQAVLATIDLQSEFFPVAEHASAAGRTVALGVALEGPCSAVLRGLRDLIDALGGAIAEGVERATLGPVVGVALGDMRQLDLSAPRRNAAIKAWGGAPRRTTAIKVYGRAEVGSRPEWHSCPFEVCRAAQGARVARRRLQPNLRHAGSDIAIWQGATVKTHEPLGARTETNRDTASDAVDARTIGHGWRSRLLDAESRVTRQRAVVSSLPDQTDVSACWDHPASVAGWARGVAIDLEKRRRRLILSRSHLDRFSAEAPSAAFAGPASGANANASDKSVALTTIHQNTEQRCCDAA